jgi:VCBS repeat-containing protein
MPTAKEILSWYLYGQSTPPAPNDLRDDRFIRPKGIDGPPVAVNSEDYMRNGGGRFVGIGNFNFVRNFLQGSDYSAGIVPPGVYSTEKLLNLYGIPLTERELGISQYFLEPTAADFKDRAYVFGSTAFRINTDARFIVKADGTREIQNIGVIPVEDNFDFKSDSPPALVTNFFTETRIDPSGIGRTVPIIFEGPITKIPVVKQSDWIELDIAKERFDEFVLQGQTAGLPIAVQKFTELMGELNRDGVIDYRDSSNRLVYFDGVDMNNAGVLTADLALDKVMDSSQFWKPARYDGVALIGGGGNDQLSGAGKSDYLLGGAGNDILDGGAGADELKGGDGDDTLDGGSGSDKLQGGKGNDKLNGGEGEDTLSADEGNDTLEGGAGSDTLEGGSDDDKLDGGGGADQLKGGAGFDTYTADAQDIITDSDGNGTVKLNGRILTGGKRKKSDPPNTYKGVGGEVYRLVGSTLLVNGLTIKNYKRGDLGIRLEEEEDIRKKPKTASTIPSPIVLDLDGDGVETQAVDQGTYFDHARDGFAELTGWVGTDDGLLVRDRDGNGQIDSGQELFGSETRLASGHKAANGFEALKELDTNTDGVIDASDAAFADLRVWKDADSNGRTDAGELLTLAEAGVQSINVAYTDSSLVDAQGNAHKQVSSYTTTAGETRTATDVWVKTDTLYSVATEWVEVPEDIAALPDAPGSGKVRGLHQAMAMDATGELKALVTAFTQATIPVDRDALITQVIYRWTGVQDVDPASRAARMIYGNAIGDARKLEALEEFMGEEWFGVWCWGTRDPNPHGRAAPVLLSAWDDLKASIYAQFMAESHLKPLLDQISYSWDEELEIFAGDLSAVAETLTQLIHTDRSAGLDALGEFLKSLKSMQLLDNVDVLSLKAELLPLGTDVAQTMQSALAGWVPSASTEGDDLLLGSNFDNLIDGQGGNDRLLGRDGNDTLIGSAGNDVLDGGAGNDELRGGVGSDTYRFGRGDGLDMIAEDSWLRGEPDRIELKAGIAPEDVTLTMVRDANSWWTTDDLVVTIKDTGETLTIKRHFDASNRHVVEEMAFSDGTVWTAEEIRGLVLIGSEADDDLRGFDNRNDVIDGGVGNDRLQGLSGDDTLIGGAGNNVLEGGSGSDTYRITPGSGQDAIHESVDADSTDTVELGEGIKPGDVTVRWTLEGDMAVHLPDGGLLTVRSQARSWLVENGLGVESLRFADGTVWNREEMAMRALAATDGDDVIVGGYEDDTLNGSAGNDRFQNLGGYDTYVFGMGDGLDVVEGSTGRILFESGVLQSDVRFSRDGDDLVADVGLAGDALRIQGWFNGWLRIERFEFADGLKLTADDVLALVDTGEDEELLQGTAGHDSLAGSDGRSRIFGYAGNDNLAGEAGNDLISGGDGNDVLNGGSGDDLLLSGTGNNVYLYDQGGGADRMQVTLGAKDTLRFGADIRPEDLTIEYEDGQTPRLHLKLSDADRVTVEFASSSGAVAGPGLAGGTLTPTSGGAIINNGLISMGVNPQGHLNVPYSGDPLGIGAMGLRYLPTGAASTEPGALAEGWGVSNGVISGYANLYNGGAINMNLISFEADAARAVSRVGVEGVFEVMHAYAPSSSPNLYQVDVTISNVSGMDQQALYRRVMDWDIYPTPFNEYVTIVNSSPLVYRTDTNGFNSGNPLSFSSYQPGPSATNGYVDLVDSGPADHGALFDFNFGRLPGVDDPTTAANETVYRFTTYYGAGASEAEVLYALGRVGAERVYSLGQPSTAYGATLGTPNTFVFAFKGVGGEAVAETPLLDRIEFADGRVFTLPELLAFQADDVADDPDGDQVFEGDAGGGLMAGGAGSDVYRIHRAADAPPAEIVIVEAWREQDINHIELTGEVNADDLRLEFDGNDLLLRYSDAGDAIRFKGFDPRAPGMQAPVAEIRLTGESVSFDALLARGVRYGDYTQDVYVVNIGDGEITIDDVVGPDAGNVLRFGPGVDPEALRNSLGFEEDGNGGYLLRISYGGDGDVLLLTGFNPNNVLGGGHAVDRFEFADGTMWDYAALVSDGFIIEGDSLANELTGTMLADRLHGSGGNDVVYGGAGSDELHSGEGDDLLHGDAGDDSYLFNKGDGVDTIRDGGATDFNFIRFGATITPEDIRREWDGTTLVLRYSDADAVRIDNYYSAEGNPVILALTFEDGTIVSLTEQMNRAPTVTGQLEDAVATEDQDFSLTLPADLFSDPDAADEIQVAVRLASGEPLPAWLAFDPVSRTLSGRPGNDNVGDIALFAEAKDHFGVATSTTFNINVQNTNDAPEAGTPLSDLRVLEDSAFSFILPADSFRDIDLGDALSYSAALESGDHLPDWLRFDAQAGTFSGTSANGDVGELQLAVTATDLAGASASQVFALEVANTNDAPTIGAALAAQTATEDAAFTFALPTDAFVDADLGDRLSYTATLADGSALPAWLQLDAVTGTFSGTPASADNYALRATATDLAGAQASQTFTLTVESGGGNLAPVTAPDAANVIEDRKLLAWGNVLSNDRDLEGKRLSVANPGIQRGEYGVLTLLSNGTYGYVLNDGSSRVQGLGAGETVTETFNYLASDGTQRSNGALTVTVQGTNDVPDLVRCLADVQLAKGKAFSWRMPAGSFVDADRNDTLSYTATLSNGKALPTWLKFDAATQSFSGTAPTNAKGSIDVRVTASDGHGECSTASDDFKISLGNKTVVLTAIKGNEGVGNGADAPPPGHDANINDGAGTSPGQPGRKHGSERGDDDGDPLARFLDGFKRDDKSTRSPHSALPALDRRWFEQWGEQQQTSGQASHGQANHDVERHWAELTHALNRLDAERQSAPAWSHANQGADLSGLAGWMQGGAHDARGGVDAVSLACGTGTHLKGFSGIKEGVGKLSW